MKRYKALKILSLTSLILSVFLSGCGSNNATVHPAPVSIGEELPRAAYIYSSEAESDEIAVIMDLSNISGTGATIRFRQYEERETGELIYGEGYAISRLENDEWVPVPQIIENGAFTDIGYMIPAGGEAKIETNWEWLYGKLPKGTYRISKTILDSYDNGYDEYVLYGKFFIAE